MDEFRKEYYADFGPGSVYDLQSVSKYKKGVTNSDYPVQGHWKTATIKDFVAKYGSNQKTGEPTSDDPDGLVCIIPLMCYFAGKPDFIERCKTGVETMQTFNTTLNSAIMAAKILEKYILKTDETSDPKVLLKKVAAEWKDIPDVVDIQMSQNIEEVIQADFSMSAIEATKKFGMA